MDPFVTPKDMVRVFSCVLIIIGLWVFCSSLDGQGHLNCDWLFCDWHEGIDGECTYPTPTLLLIWRFIYSSAMLFGAYMIFKISSQPGFGE